MAPSPNKHPEVSAATVLGQGLPILDVRAPVEFAKGAVPGSTNLPILDDAERAAVGTTYRKEGHDAAVAQGFDLVSGATRAERLNAWETFLQAHPRAALTCWRGGQRSQIAQTWLFETGIEAPRVSGGYKALRHHCLAQLEHTVTDKHWWVVAGRTGTGKTVVINALSNAIDLEGAANHRGSAFGAMPTPQPAQASFENALAYAALALRSDQLVVEDESRTIGRIGVPASWHAAMQEAPLVLVEASIESRALHIKAEYVDEPLQRCAPDVLAASYKAALDRIRRRLGGALHQEISRLLDRAFAGAEDHAVWIAALLEKYYDPMYDYQLERKRARIRFEGDRNSVIEHLRHHTA